MASAVGAPTGGRLRGGCDVGSWGEGIQWCTVAPHALDIIRLPQEMKVIASNFASEGERV